MLKNKNKRNMFSKFIKKFIIGIIIILGVVTVIGGFVSSLENDDSIASKLFKKSGYIEYVERPKEDVQVSAYNADGTPNGLNLLLIDNITTEGFIKEYLTLARDSQEGKLSNYSEHAPITAIIGLAMVEEGGYYESGGLIPNTCLPWDSSSNSPIWDKSKHATLSEADMSVFTQIGYNSQAWRVGDYVGPYQQTESYFSGMYNPSNMNGYGMSSSRTSGDWSYFPDQLAGLDYEYCNISGVDVSKIPDESRLMITSLNHNVGVSWKKQFLSKYKNGDLTEGVITLCKDFSEGFEKFSSKLGNTVLPNEYTKWIANFILMEQGWCVTERDVDGNSSYNTMKNTNRDACFQVFTTLGLGNTKEDMDNYLSSHHKQPTDWGDCGRAVTQGTIWKDFGADGRMYLLTETAGHILGSSFMGPLYYARLLKLAGVDVDPNNPDTYMNKIEQNGEWTPSGNTDWMNEYGIDSSIGEFRLNVLSWAFKCVGLVYDFGGSIDNIKPENFKENADGTLTFPKFDTWDKGLPMSSAGVNGWGFDCGGFTGYCYMKAGATGFPHMSTYSQISSSAVRQVNYSQAKAGDIFFTPSVGHTGIFLKDNGDGTFTYIDSNQSWEGGEVGGTRGSIKVRSGRSYSGYTFVSYVGAD